MADNEPMAKGLSGNELVKVSDWNACFNSEDNVIALSCTVITNDSSATITGVGLILNNSEGVTLCSAYTEFSGGCESVTPAIDLPPGGLAVGTTVLGAVDGEVEGEHFFFEQKLTVGNCPQ